MEKQFIQVQVAEGVSRLEILEGEALNPVAPRPIQISGKIDAPTNWWKVRRDKINHDTCHVVVDDLGIQLVYDENNGYHHSYVRGNLAVDPECAQWGINADRFYDNKSLARNMKANEYLFSSREEWLDLVNSLMRFEANVQVNIKDIKTTNGDIDRALKVTVENQLPTGFKLKTKIFGEERLEYHVDLGAEFHGHQVKFYLDSSELAYMMSEQKEQLIEQHVKEFRADGIAVIHV